jgi:hypothetical protein
MTAYAGDGHWFWQLRFLSPKPSFTATLNNGTASGPADTNGSDEAGNDRKAAHQDEKLPQLVGGGLGVPGSKERVLHILREKGYNDVIPVVEVGAVLQCMGLDAGNCKDVT